MPQKLINMLPFARNPVWLRWSGTRGNASIVAENRARRAARRVMRRKMLWVAAFCVGLIFCALPAFSALQDQSGTQKHSTSPSGPLGEARSALAGGNAEQAVQILSTYLKSHPEDAPAHILLGQAYASVGENERAEEQFQTSLHADPENPIALAALGELYEQAGKPEDAEPLLGRAAKASPGVPQIRIEWAVALAQLHKYKEAQSALAGIAPPSGLEQRIVFYRLKGSVAFGLGDARTAASEMDKALALRPTDAGLAMATAVVELQLKNPKRAAALAEPIYSETHSPDVGLVCLEAELESHADFHATLDSLRGTQVESSEELAFRQHLAASLISAGKFVDAIADLQAAADLDPSRADLQYNLALAQFRAARLDDAEKTAEKCKALSDDADLESLIGDIQEARGNSVEAAKSYQAAIALDPREEKYRLSLAVEFIRHSNLDAARVVLKQAEEQHPDSWQIELTQGMVEYFAGTDDDATRYLLHAVELAPDPALALQYLGDVQMDRASAPDPAALTQLCEYSDRQPKDGHMQYYCGATLFRRDYVTRDKSHADEILRRLRTSETLLPKDVSPHCQLGKAYRWLERWPEALTESKICVRMDPNSADAHYRLAQIYQHMGQKEQSQNEVKLYEAASTKLAEENAHREATMKTFIYTMQNRPTDQQGNPQGEQPADQK